MKFFGVVLTMLFFTIPPSMAQTIMENPTACFGRDCNPAAAVPANLIDDDNCTSVDSRTITYNLDRPGCKNIYLPGNSAISINFGQVETKTPYHRFALYSIDEIRNTVAKYGPKVRMSAIFTGTYKACPSMDSWLNIGLSLQESIMIMCGNNNNLATIGFPIDSKVGRFNGFFNKDFQSDVVSSYKDFDLSKCSDDLILWYSSSNICAIDIELLQLVFEQK